MSTLGNLEDKCEKAKSSDLQEIKSRYESLVKTIIIQREKCANIISKHMKGLIVRKKVKKFILLKKILEKRKEDIVKIQRNVRYFFTRKIIKEICEKENKEFIHLYFDKPCYEATVKIINKDCIGSANTNNSSFELDKDTQDSSSDKSKKIKDIWHKLEKCKLRKYHITYIEVKDIERHQKYYFNFYIDGHPIISTSYPGEYYKGDYYNYLIPKKVLEQANIRRKMFNFTKRILFRHISNDIFNSSDFDNSKQQKFNQIISPLIGKKHNTFNFSPIINSTDNGDSSYFSENRKTQRRNSYFEQFSRKSCSNPFITGSPIIKSILKKPDSKSDLRKRVSFNIVIDVEY